MKIDLLDHGYIKFIEASGTGEAGVGYQWEHDGEQHEMLSDRDYEVGIIEAARQSTQKGFQGWDSDAGLLAYLFNSDHDTPFEFADCVVEVQAPIVVFREWHRHRTQCLAADAQLIFDQPRGKPLKLGIGNVVGRWNSTFKAKRSRRARSQVEFDRERLGGLRLRSPGGHVNIVDAWHSGEKRLWEIRTNRGRVKCSADHRILTPNGWATIDSSPREIIAMVQAGKAVIPELPRFTRNELRSERWVEVFDGYEVSDLGRIRSYWTTRSRKVVPTLKAACPNTAGRLVVGIKGKTWQVSHLVWAAFSGDRELHILHQDGNAWNNRFSNLYEGTDVENSHDRILHDAQTCLRSVPVRIEEIRESGFDETFDITVTGDHSFVVNNLIVHNSYNEMSARYAPLPDLYYIPDSKDVAERMIEGRFSKNKQAQATAMTTDPVAIAQHFVYQLKDGYESCEAEYQQYLEWGVPKELARLIMPVGHYTRMRAKANLRNWLSFMTLRSAPNAMKEIRIYSDALGTILASKFPRTFALFEAERKRRAQEKRIVAAATALVAALSGEGVEPITVLEANLIGAVDG